MARRQRGLIEAEVVTADGRVRVVNACQNPELYWALKGGGGGSFGVVTRVTLRTRELPDYFGVVHTAIKATSDEAYRAAGREADGVLRERPVQPALGRADRGLGRGTSVQAAAHVSGSASA